MSEDTTQDMADSRPFEQRVLSALENIIVRLEALEEKVELRMHDTRPIWERALSEIMETNKGLAEVNKRLASVERKMDVLGRDVLNLRADISGLDERLTRLESGGEALIIGGFA
jgi:chromosome segregation ATPase